MPRLVVIELRLAVASAIGRGSSFHRRQEQRSVPGVVGDEASEVGMRAHEEARSLVQQGGDRREGAVGLGHDVGFGQHREVEQKFDAWDRRPELIGRKWSKMRKIRNDVGIIGRDVE